MSIFDVPISFYASAYDKAPNPATISLRSFLKTRKEAHVSALFSAREFYAKMNAETDPEQRRNYAEKYKRKKAGLPAATIAGVSRYIPDGKGGSRCEILTYSGFMQLDIDGKDHPHYTPAQLFDALKTLPHAAYVGRSVSGEGLFVLIRISDPPEYAQHYEAAKKCLASYKIVCDPKGKSPYLLRFIAPDPEAYFNENAPVFTLKAEGRPEPRPVQTKPVQPNAAGAYDLALLCLEEIERRGIDVTSDAGSDTPATWLRLASSFVTEYGEAGREYFHRLSRFYQTDTNKYTRTEADAVYTNALRRNNGTGIGYFMAVCKSNGILAKDLIREKRTTAPPVYTRTAAAPYGVNPFTGEIFDERGYPSTWDNVLSQ